MGLGEDLSRNKALPWSHRFYERFAEKWNINNVAQIYDGNIRKLNREQVIRLLETQQTRICNHPVCKEIHVSRSLNLRI